MENHYEPYSKFKTFLKHYFIRKKNGEYDPNDFRKDKFEYIQPHLGNLLPHLSLNEVMRIQVYFTNVFIFFLNDGLNKPNIPPQRPLTPTNSIAENVTEEQIFELNEQGTQQPIINVSDFSSQPFPQKSTPLDSIHPAQSRRTVPLSQSTPLSVNIQPTEAGILLEQQRLQREEDYFITDVLSQINISSIPGVSAPLRTRPDVPPRAMSPPNIEQPNVSFLRNFQRVPEQNINQSNIPRIRCKRPRVAQPILIAPKKKMDKINFDVLCCLPLKKKNEQQIKQSEESFLHFPLMPGKTKNIITRIIKNIVIPKGERGHISMQRSINLSNALRAHASQRQTSVELPVQMNPLSSTRSPTTPQALLRSSQLLPFTPFGGDTSSPLQRIEKDQATSIPLRSLLRQQTLLPIPEREGSIHVPLSPQVEGIYNNHSTNMPAHIEIAPEIPLNTHENPETCSNIPRAIPEDTEMNGEPLLQNVNNDALLIQTQQQEILLNSSLINIQPLPEHEPNIPMGLTESQSLNLPRVVSEEGIEQLIQVSSVDNLSRILPVVEEHSLLIPTSVARNNEGLAPLNIEQTIALHDVPPVGRREHIPNFSWYEILRPRNNIPDYPLEGATRRKKRRRQRTDSEEHIFRPSMDYVLPDIPMSPPRENLNELPTVPTDSVLNQASDNIPPNPESVTLQPLNVQPHIDVHDQISHTPHQINLELIDHDFAETALGPTVEFSAPSDGSSKQITQHPISKEIDISPLKTYLELIKKAGRRTDYNNWERFDPNLFSENDNFEIYTYIFKRIIKDNYVQMDTLYEKGTTRIEAAKGFRFILELKKMGLIEIETIGTRILGFRLKSADNI